MNPFPSIKRGILAFLGWIRIALCALMTEDGRKGWAMLAALGCAFVMTGISLWSMWLSRENPSLSFALGLAAMVIITIVITGLMWLLGVRRDTEINLKDGTVKTSDSNVARAAATPLEAAPIEPGA